MHKAKAEGEALSREARVIEEKSLPHADPRDLESSLRRALALKRIGKLTEAEATFREALAVQRKATSDGP